jgi:hypothetical protein
MRPVASPGATGAAPERHPATSPSPAPAHRRVAASCGLDGLPELLCDPAQRLEKILGVGVRRLKDRIGRLRHTSVCHASPFEKYQACPTINGGESARFQGNDRDRPRLSSEPRVPPGRSGPPVLARSATGPARASGASSPHCRRRRAPYRSPPTRHPVAVEPERASTSTGPAASTNATRGSRFDRSNR